MALKGHLYRKLKPRHKKYIENFYSKVFKLPDYEKTEGIKQQKMREETKRNEEERQKRAEERHKKQEERELQRFEQELIGKKRASPFKIKELYLECFVRKYGKGSEKELNKLNRILTIRKIELEKPLEDAISETFEKEQKKKGLEKFVDSNGNERWGNREEVKKWREIEIGISDNFKKIHWKDFENIMAELLTKMGYRNVCVTKSTGDYGIDILAKKRNRAIAIQCKKWKGGVVNNKNIRDAIGGAISYHAKKLIFITTARFTREAEEQANMSKESGMEIELWDEETLKNYMRKYMIR